MLETVTIGQATLYYGDCREVLPTLASVDAVITDPPYSERCHAAHDAGASKARDSAERQALGYRALTLEDVTYFAEQYARVCGGWVVWMTDSDLALAVRTALEKAGRYAFAPLPFYLLMDALVADYSRPGYTVLDTHMGAGTTGVACARAGRKFIGCEVDRAAFDLACERIAAAYAQGSLLDLAQPVPEQQGMGF